MGLDLLLGLSTGPAGPSEHLGSDRPPPAVLYSLESMVYGEEIAGSLPDRWFGLYI